MVFGNHDLWSYYLDLHRELYNRGLTVNEASYGIMNITWSGDEKLLVEYVCEIDYKMIQKINSKPWLQSINR